MGAAIGLWDVVGKTQHLFGITVIPLHGHFGRDGCAGLQRQFALRVKDVGVEHRLAAVDVIDKTFDAPAEGKVLFARTALVEQLDAHAVVEEGQFAQPLGKDLVMKLNGPKDAGISHEMHFGTTATRSADHLHRAHLNTIDLFDDAVHGMTTVKFHVVFLAVTTDGELEPIGERVDATHTNAMQTARDLVAVLVELAAGVQHAHDDLGRRALRLVLVVHLHTDRDTTAVVDHADAVVGVDGDDDVVAVTGKRLVDGVVDHFEHHVMQAGAIRCVADVHARPFADSL